MGLPEFHVIDQFLVWCMNNVSKLGLSPFDRQTFVNVCSMQREIAVEAMLAETTNFPLKISEIMERVK